MQTEVPVLFVVFNRYEETKAVFEAIKKARPKKLFISADAPRANKEGEAQKCDQVRKLAELVDWECELQTRFLEENLGCRLAVSSAIDWFFEHVDSGIILEDDCLPSMSFFRFCEYTLNKYKDDDRVMQISGSCFLQDHSMLEDSYYFSRLNDIWGWATWKRAWKHFDLEMNDYDHFKKKGRILDYFSNPQVAQWLEYYLDESAYGPSTVWSTQWTYAMIKNNALTVVPNINLVENIGFHGVGMNAEIDSFSLYSQFKALEWDENIVSPKYVLPHGLADEERFNVIKLTDPRFTLKFKINRLRASIRSFIR